MACRGGSDSSSPRPRVVQETLQSSDNPRKVGQRGVCERPAREFDGAAQQAVVNK